MGMAAAPGAGKTSAMTAGGQQMTPSLLTSTPEEAATPANASISAQIGRRSFQIVESTIPPNVTLDEWRRVRAPVGVARSRCSRLAGDALNALRAPKVRLT
jgi:hypothetical protein